MALPLKSMTAVSYSPKEWFSNPISEEHDHTPSHGTPSDPQKGSSQ
jgi:hypothetical protein